jgi:thiamine-monophosphate kinase
VAITVAVLGDMGDRGNNMLTRSAARPGEQVAVTGALGAAAAGLEMLTGRLGLDPQATNHLRSAFLHPRPRLAEGQLLVEQGVKAAIDISDGLISDLKQVCKSSQVGARIEIDRLPIDPTVEANFSDRSLELALSGGEEYELLFTAREELIDRVQRAASCSITVIGEIVADRPGEVTLIDAKGSPFSLGKAGWEHFTTG